jgi:hypothetical protein
MLRSPALTRTRRKPTRNHPAPSFPRRRESRRRWFGERPMDSRLRGNDGVFGDYCVTSVTLSGWPFTAARDNITAQCREIFSELPTPIAFRRLATTVFFYYLMLRSHALTRTRRKTTVSLPAPSFPRRRESRRQWFGKRPMDFRLRGNDGVFGDGCVTSATIDCRFL